MANLTINRIVIASDWVCSDTLLAVWYKAAPTAPTAPTAAPSTTSTSTSDTHTKPSAQQQQDAINHCSNSSNSSSSNSNSNSTNSSGGGGGGGCKLEAQFVFADWKILKVKKPDPTKEYRSLYLQQLRLAYKANFQSTRL